MKKKFFAMYALAGALVASPVFTSCVDDSVSDSVEALRDANVKYKNAQAAQAEAQAALNQANAANTQAMSALNQEAQRLDNEATAAYNAYIAAVREYELAEKEYQVSLREYKQALQEKKDSIEIAQKLQGLEDAKLEYEKQQAYLEQTKISNESNQLKNEIDKATLELDIELAKIKAQADIATQKATLQSKEQELANALEKLENKAKNEAKLLNSNANAIMMGGTFYTGIFENGQEKTIKYGAEYGQSNTQANSIIALMSKIAEENANLLTYNAGLVTINEWIRTETIKKNNEIAANEAKIALYKELQASGTLADMKKAYEEAVKNNESYTQQIAEKGTATYNAQKAIDDYELAELAKIGTEEENGIIAYLKENSLSFFSTTPADFYLTAVPFIGADTEEDESDDSEENYYIHTEENAADLANAIAAFDEEDGQITEAKNAVEKRLAAIEKVKKEVAEEIVSNERDLVVLKADLAKLQKEYADVIASEAYKAKLADLQKDVTDAQAAFEANPSNFEEYPETVTNEDGSTTIKIVKSTKQLLEEAEKALADIDKNYLIAGADTEDESDDKSLLDLYEQLKGNEEEGIEGFEETVANLQQTIEDAKAYTEEEYDAMAMEVDETETLEDLEEAVEEAEEAKQELVDLQALFAPESEAMVAYNAWIEGYAELVEAKMAVAEEVSALETQQQYWSGIESDLKEYVTEDGTDELPDYAELIEGLNADIAEAKAAIASLAGAIEDEDDDDAKSKISMESVIKQTEAKIAAMEAELERNQADYDAIMKELDALVNAETAE